MKKWLRIFVFTAITVTASFTADSYASREAAYRYNSEGLEKMEKGDYEGAISDLKQALQYLPSEQKIRDNLGIVYNNYGFYLMRQSRLDLAVEQFRKALYYTPDNPYVLYNMGQAFYRSQKMPQAREHLEKAYAISPDIRGLKDLLEKARQESSVERTFERNETMHFIIASAPDVESSKLTYTRTYLEDAYGRVGTFLDHYPRDKVVAILYSESNYRKMLGDRPHWTLAIFDGKVRIPVNRFRYTDEDIIKIIFHEYAHAVVYDMTGGRTPLWLNEGIASMAEGLVDPRDTAMFGRYISKTGFIPLRALPGDFSYIKDRKLATLVYMESYLLVDFLVKRGGRGALHDILEGIGRGEDPSLALMRVMDTDPVSFETSWESYVKEVCGLTRLRYR